MTEKQSELVWTEDYNVHKCLLFKGLLKLVVSYESPPRGVMGNGHFKASIGGFGSVRLKTQFASVDDGKEATLAWVRKNIAEPKP